MKAKKKKTPADYPQMQFKVDQATKDDFTHRIDRLVDLYNSKKSPEELKTRKNDVIIDALKKGLKVLEKKVGI